MNSAPLQSEEIVLFRTRTIVIALIVTLFFSLLASRLWYLQILNGQKYADFSKGNRIRLIPHAAPRGVIYDRNGMALAYNRPAYQLQLILEDTPDLEHTLQNLSQTLKTPYASLRKLTMDKRHQAPFKPIILEEDLDYRKAVLIETYQEEFPGVSIVVRSRRFYPHNKVASHILGYVGKRSEQQEEQLPANKRSSGQVVGRAGIELIENDSLIGTDGGKQVEVDHVGRELRVLNKPVNPVPGQNIYLTIDFQLQQLIYEAMKNKQGSVIVMNPKTGEVLAMSSFPSFNPNLFSAGISRKNWNRLVNTDGHPLENKASQGSYPPGSVFKLITGYAGLDSGTIDEETTHTCNGFFYLKGRRAPYKCWKWREGGHGVVNLRDAIRESCNIFFYHVGHEVGIDRLAEYAQSFGLGKRVGIRLLNEKMGLVPNSAWKQEFFGSRWYAGETPPVAIGQGYTVVTPLQTMNLINIIANGGHFIPPALSLEEVDSSPTEHLGLSEAYLQILKEGMIEAVSGKNGTAKVIHSEQFNIAGKTATAQVVGHKTLASLNEEERQDPSLQSHAWLVAFAPIEDPEIAITVLVEHGGNGSTGAGPIAKQILEYYQNHLYPLTPNPASDSFGSRLNASFQTSML